MAPAILGPEVNDDPAFENDTEAVNETGCDRVPRISENIDSYVNRMKQCSNSSIDSVSDNEELPESEKTSSNELNECPPKIRKTSNFKKSEKAASKSVRSSNRVRKVNDNDSLVKKSTEEDKVLPRTRRKSVQAGLYSDYFKTDT